MNELVAPADFDFSREHTIKFTLAADQSAINFLLHGRIDALFEHWNRAP